MTATTRVRRAEVDADDLAHVVVCSLVVVSGWSVVGGRVVGASVDVGGRDGDEGRAEDAVAEAVAAPDLLDDLALGAAGARDVGDRLVLARVERRAGRGVDRRSRPRSRAAGAACGRWRRCPRPRGRSAIDAGRASMARSKSSARARTLRIRSSPARPRSRSRSSAVRRLKFWNSARSRWSAAEVLVGGLAARRRARRSAVSIWASRARRRDVDLVGALLGAGPVVVAQAYRWSTSSFIRPDTKRTVPIACGVATCGSGQDADDADRPARPAVRREDERDVAHLERRVLVADEDLDAAGAGDAADQLAEVGPVLEGARRRAGACRSGRTRAPP